MWEVCHAHESRQPSDPIPHCIMLKLLRKHRYPQPAFHRCRSSSSRRFRCETERSLPVPRNLQRVLVDIRLKYYNTKMALGRAHTFTKAQQCPLIQYSKSNSQPSIHNPAKSLLLKKRRKTYSVMQGQTCQPPN